MIQRRGEIGEKGKTREDERREESRGGKDEGKQGGHHTTQALFNLRPLVRLRIPRFSNTISGNFAETLSRIGLKQ